MPFVIYSKRFEVPLFSFRSGGFYPCYNFSFSTVIVLASRLVWMSALKAFSVFVRGREDDVSLMKVPVPFAHARRGVNWWLGPF